MNKTFAFFAALIGTIKNRQVFIFQKWSAFYSSCSAYIIVGGINLLIRKTKRFQQVPVKIEILLWFKAQSLQTGFTQSIHIEHKTYFKCSNSSSIQFFNFIRQETFFAQRLVIDMW